MPVFAIASKPDCPHWDRVQKRVEERRAVIENARRMNAKRLQADVQRIFKKEAEFAQKVIEEIVPVKVTWNEEAWERVQEFIPIRVKVTEAADSKEPSATVVEPVVMDEEKM